MSPARPNHHMPLHRRHGLVAVNELLIVVAILGVMFWLVSQFIETTTDGPHAPGVRPDASSDRCVYRISLDDDQERLWIYRPREGLVQINLETKEIERSVLLTNGVSTIAHSLDGQSTLVCGVDKTIVWSRHGETPLVTHLEEGIDMVIEAAVSKHGETAACVSVSGKVSAWVKKGSETLELRLAINSKSNVAKIGLNPSGTRMFVGLFDGSVKFFDIDSEFTLVKEMRIDPKPGVECSMFVWSDDEQSLVSFDSDGTIRVHNVPTGELVMKSRLPQSGGYCRPMALVFSRDGRYVAMSTNVSPDIHVWDVETGRMTGELKGHLGIVRTLQFPTPDRLYSGSYDGSVREWNLKTFSQAQVID